ncbi:hypothetical protein QEO94_11290 [Kingella negevensis]|uniref:hypothetical protein n=1 Tax=Kingella negevensis TaxID=1522312 RepID=UPI0025433F6C|nr:hypothetical protein [Kingella negevensis]WII93183.1 hypothetical protein QEO94_11290 [Kingella negevensis]
MNLLSIKLSGEPLNTVQFGANQANEPRQFSGIAHSGQPFEHYGTRYIVDLSNITPLDKSVGVLIEHNPNQRAGAGRLSVQNNQLHISGSLLNNEHGNAIAADADGAFPFEMSAYIQAARWEELTNGATAIVNGQTVSGNIVIMRDCVVREVSFVAVGVDKHTSAVVLSDGTAFVPQFQLSQKENAMTKEEQAQFDELQAKLAAAEKENADLKAEKAKSQKKVNVNTKLSVAGFALGEDGKFKGVSDSTYALLLSAADDVIDGVIGDLKLGLGSGKPKLPESLTQDTHAPETQTVVLSGLPQQPQKPTLGGYSMV